METQIRKLRTVRQELFTTLNSGLKFGKNDVKSESQLLVEIDEILDEMENALDYSNTGILHKFFNHKSDANKYLKAEQQEELEKEFDEWVNNNGNIIPFNEAVEPAIRYLFKNCDTHTKIYIDYSNAELLQGRKCHNLNNEIPD